MKFDKNVLIAAGLAVSCLMPLGVAQDAEEVAPPPSREMARERMEKTRQMLKRAVKHPERLPVDLQEAVADMEAARKSLAEVWRDEFKPEAGASAEEIKAARQAFRAKHAADVEASKELRKQVIADLREHRRQGPDTSDWTEEQLAVKAEYEAAKEAFAAAWKAARSELGQDATKEERAAAKAAFEEAHAALIAERKALAKEFRAAVKANRPEVIRERPEVSDAVRALRAELRAKREAQRDLRKQVRAETKELSEEESRLVRQSYREEFKALNNDIKEQRRKVIEELTGDQDGDRRPEG